MVADPYKYFRIEGRELSEGLARSVGDLEQDSTAKAAVAAILRLAHTLKGAARVVKQTAIADFAHALEDRLVGYRDRDGPVSEEHGKAVRQLIDAMNDGFAKLGNARADSPTVSGKATASDHELSAGDDLFATMRVEVSELDRLLDSVVHVSVRLSELRQLGDTVRDALKLADALDRQLEHRLVDAKLRLLSEGLTDSLGRFERQFSSEWEQTERLFKDMGDSVHRLRLFRASIVFSSLERAARDAAETLKKKETFSAVGADLRLDSNILSGVKNALLHAVRNAVAHGLESEAERLAVGKSGNGHIQLVVERRGSQMVFICRDDGRGFDVEAIGRAAIARGLIGPKTRLDMHEATRLVLNGQLTTSASADAVSGRGIGLDVVRESMARLKGDVSITSEPGVGTSVELRVPISLSSLTALYLESEGERVALPLVAVRQTLRVNSADVLRGPERETIVVGGQVVPFLPLSRALGKKEKSSGAKTWSVAVVGGRSGQAAIAVDRLLGAATVVLRSLPAYAMTTPIVAGASLDAQGNPELVLDPDGLVAAANDLSFAPSTPTAPKLILIVDDSLTTRMLEQAILESAGYQVDLATSAEEGLKQARTKPYGLFLVDVEMPGMDGFEFVKQTQADAQLRNTPTILVTSRSAPEDKQRAQRVGARGYVVKGEFDQKVLLKKIRELLGLE